MNRRTLLGALALLPAVPEGVRALFAAQLKLADDYLEAHPEPMATTVVPQEVGAQEVGAQEVGAQE